MIPLVLILLPVGTAHGQASSVALTLTAPTTTIKIGAPLDVQVTLTNTATQDIALSKSLGESEAEFNYDFQVTDMMGKTPQEKRLRKRVKAEASPAITHSNQIVPLKPGGAISETADLTKLFDLSHPGVYKIRARRVLPKDVGGAVVSNQITITVVP